MQNPSASPNFFRRHIVLTIILAIIALIVLFILYLAIKPIDISNLGSNPDPATSYDDAVARFDAFSKAETDNPAINTDCYSDLKTHGEETDIVYVFYHGLTSCPSQFNVLGKDFYDDGYNVLIPRLPGHGFADQDIAHLEDLTAEELTAFGDQTVDMAEGLGKKVVVVGLSGGGTISGWIGVNRSDVQAAVLLNPFFSISQIPSWATKTVTNFGLTIPNMNFYSNAPASSSSSSSSKDNYHGLSTQGESQFMHLGLAVIKMAKQNPPGVSNFVAMVLQNDPVVNNQETRKFINKVISYPEIAVVDYMISDDHGLPHDIITPESNVEDTDYVYSLIMRILPGSPDQIE